MGGAADAISTYLQEHYTTGLSRAEALTLTARALGQGDAGHRSIAARDLEVAVLDRSRTQERKFRRLSGPALLEILGEESTEPETPAAGEPAATGEPTTGGPETAPAPEEPPTAPPT